MDLDGRTILRRDDDGVATARFDEEAVLYEIESSSLHRLNATAAAVWDACDGSCDVAGIIAAFVDAYPEVDAHEIADGVRAVLLDFISSGLVASGSVEQTEDRAE